MQASGGGKEKGLVPYPMNVDASLLPARSGTKHSYDGYIFDCCPLQLTVADIQPWCRVCHVVVYAHNAHHKLLSWPWTTLRALLRV